MDAFGVLDTVLTDYENFVKGFLDIKNDQIRAKVETEIEDGLLWPEPWLAPRASVARSFTRASSTPRVSFRFWLARARRTRSRKRSPSGGC